jgi:hypothetical protein
MLKVLEVEGGSPASLLFRLEGKLIGRWVQELSRLCEPILNRGDQLTLDCEAVGFADADGIALMKALRCRDVRLLRCSPFINLQLDEMDVPKP